MFQENWQNSMQKQAILSPPAPMMPWGSWQTQRSVQNTKKGHKHNNKMSKLEAICNNQRRAWPKKIYFHCLPWFLTARKWAVFRIGLFFSNVAASIIDHISNFHQKRTIFLSIMYLSLLYICVENKHLKFQFNNITVHWENFE